MNIKQIAKRNPFINRLGKRINIYRAFCSDAKEFANNYEEESKQAGDVRYTIMLLTHSLEKGMCMDDPRPFGVEKVRELMSCLQKMELTGSETFEYKLGLSILNAWTDFFEKHGWTSERAYPEVYSFIKKRVKPEIEAGMKEYAGPGMDLSDKYGDVITTRHSVRDFKPDKLSGDDIRFAVNCFSETPTACNRQMCRLLYIENTDVKGILDKYVIGLPGFNKAATQYFVITYDLAAFAYSGERHQGLFNAGLCTTNVINGLHARGIGSCCLQWSNKPAEDRLVRKVLGLRESEKIGIVIGCGYYKEKNIIPCSVRKPVEDTFGII